MNRKPTARQVRCTLAIAFVSASLAIYWEHPRLLSYAGRWLNVSAPLNSPVDDVMVLGGDLKVRPLVAASIFRSGMARRVLIPQVTASEDVIDRILPPNHEIVRQVLLRSGVPTDAIIVLPEVVDSTAQEAARLAAYLNEHPSRRVAIVTSNYHTRRTKWVFMSACKNHSTNLSFVGAPTDGFGPADWWRYEPGLVEYTAEFLKLVKTFLD